MAKSKKNQPEEENTLSTTKKTTKGLSRKGTALSSELGSLYVEDLSDAYRCLAGMEPVFKAKNELCKQVALLLDFNDQEEFDIFFGKLPLYLQEVKIGRAHV